MSDVQKNILSEEDRDVARKERIARVIHSGLEARSPGEIDISFDGKRVAFVVWEWLPGEQTQRGRIWVSELDGGDARPFLSGKYDELSPRWSPDGKYLAFITRPSAGEHEKLQLHLIPAEGGEIQLVCRMPEGVSDLAWSPDGERITFLSLDGADDSRSDPRVLASAPHQRLWTVRYGQAVPEPVTPHGITIREYVWSPDSKHVAVYYSEGSEYTDWYHSEVGIVSATGGEVKQLTQLTSPARALAWSPDSCQVAYLSGHWSDPGRGSGDIFAVTTEHRQVRNLTPGIDVSPTWCHWLPDGHHLLYTAVSGVTHQIGLLDSRDGSRTLLEADFVMQADQPRLAITPDCQRLVTVHGTAQQPDDIWSGILHQKGNSSAAIEWKQLTRLNPLLEALPVTSKTERIRYESVDGWFIDGLLTTPIIENGQNGKLPPLLVSVHGGPSGAVCDSYTLRSKVFSTAGYAVFQPNMRGSWGHGATFADAVLGDMGGKDFQDILNGVEYLVQQGRVDGERVCIGGWSNGGFLSAWAITKTQRFKAAMVGAGITNWINMHGQSNIPDADVMLLDANPLEKPEVYLQNSPITHARRITTPTLILHGEDDRAVPVAEAYEFHRALQESNVPVECVIYPREGHGLSEHDHVYDMYERQLRWFDRYVLSK